MNEFIILKKMNVSVLRKQVLIRTNKQKKYQIREFIKDDGRFKIYQKKEKMF